VEELLQTKNKGGSNTSSMSFFKALGVLKYIMIKPRIPIAIGTAGHDDLLCHTPVYFLMSCSPAELTSAFTGTCKNKKSKAYSGLSLNCKFVHGLINKNCQLFSGRVISPPPSFFSLKSVVTCITFTKSIT
jgi:hypothetical protein